MEAYSYEQLWSENTGEKRLGVTNDFLNAHL